MFPCQLSQTLSPHKRQKSQKARPLNGNGQSPLMLGAGRGMPGIYNLGLRRSKSTQKFWIFVVQTIYVLRAEKALIHRGSD